MGTAVDKIFLAPMESIEPVTFQGKDVGWVTGGRQIVPTPISDAAERLERFMASSDIKRSGSAFQLVRLDAQALAAEQRSFLKLMAGVKDEALSRTSPVPPALLAQMRLSEYFFETEGDLAETVMVPIELGMQSLRIEGGDKAVLNDLQILFGEQGLNLEEVLNDIWLNLEILGNAFPFVVWENNRIPRDIISLDPKQVMVGRSGVGFPSYVMGQKAASNFIQDLESNYALRDMVWRSAGAFDANQQAYPQGYFVLDGENVTHLRAKGTRRSQRYGVPPLSRVFRTISTRQVLEEMVRATIEGIRNQLWLFLLGDAEHAPSPAELANLKGALAGSAGERTGYFVWPGNLRVEQHIPKVDQMLGNEKWKELTMHLMRQRGVSLRIISGESPSQRGYDPNGTDVTVLIQRIQYQQRLLLRWVNSLIVQYVERNVTQPRVLNRVLANLPKVSFNPISMDVEDQIRMRLLPMYTAGLVSKNSFLSETGMSYEQELSNKKKEQKDEEYFSAPAVYNQKVVDVNKNSKETAVNPGQNNKNIENDPGQTNDPQHGAHGQNARVP